ncbi:MAG TPA: ATP-binding protein, partial [Flavisolibacter sp.]
QDLLVFAEVGGSRPEPEEVDLQKILDDVVSDLEVAIKEREAVVKVELLGRIKGDALHLHQLFQNLLSNALKYSHHDKQPEIIVSFGIMNGKETGLAISEWEMQQSFCVISVKDNGQGFTAEEATQIFKIFQRLPQHRYEQSGTGIGLAIVQRVVENHKGYIRAEGVPGEGATFKIYLPVT